MNDYTLESGIPIPPRSHGRRSRSEFTNVLATMEIGDSFLAEKIKVRSLSSCGRTLGRKFISRSDGDKVRIWRVE
jgi:hypothetical protein